MDAARAGGAAVLALLLFAGGAARAGTNTATLTVRATVETGCSVSGDVLDFGTYISGQTGDGTGHAAIEITNCNGTTVTIGIGGGNSGDPANRYMTSSDGSQLRYQVYQSPGGQDAWIGPMTTPIAGDPATVHIYGIIPGGQTVPPGVYEDTLTVTVTFQ